jgi:signal transduction histidine kinase
MSLPDAEAERAAASAREQLVELIGLHARAMLRMPWVQLMLVLGIGFLTLAYVSVAIFLAWAAASISIELIRARYAGGVLQRGYEIDPRRVHLAFVALAAISGGVIGLGAMLFLPALPLYQQTVLGAAMLVIPAAGVAVSQSSRYIQAAYALCLVLPAGATWGALHPGQSLGVAALTILLCAVLILAAADGDKLLLRSVSIRHERDRLVRDLERRNTEVGAAMERAEQSAQARARVLAAASHDLRQPLHALSVYSAVLAARPAPETLEEVSQNVDQIVRALGNLLNGLLDLSRLSAGYYVPEHQNLALERLAADVCAEYAQPAAQKGLVLRCECESIRLLGDPVAIGRILRNLLDNAIKYTEAGEVSVTTSLDCSGRGATAVLRVSDTGRGIPAGEQGRIFEEFYQLDNPGRDRSRGVGLGLAIVQRLCELIGAKVEVRSVMGRGTSFCVSMPVELAEPPPDMLPHAQTDAVLRGRVIYVVDDEQDILKSTQTLLEIWGVAVATARSPAETDFLFERAGRPDLMIVDLRLGSEEHGVLLADRLQQLHGHFPVLITTGETSSDALLQANQRKFTLLQKPIAPEVLHRAIVTSLASR